MAGWLLSIVVAIAWNVFYRKIIWSVLKTGFTNLLLVLCVGRNWFWTSNKFVFKLCRTHQMAPFCRLSCNGAMIGNTHIAKITSTRQSPSWIRNWSHIATHLVVLPLLVLVVGATQKKGQGSVVSNRIGMKFGRNVLQVNTHRLSESDFLIRRHNFDMAAMTSFHAAKCCRLANVLTSGQRLCSSARQFLIYSTFVLVSWLLYRYQHVFQCHRRRKEAIRCTQNIMGSSSGR